MITYEKALELKNAGFNQEKTERYDATNYYSGEYVPTLSELIDACGPDFVALVRWEVNLWTASNCERDTPMVHRGMEIKTEGSTPEEAVANLWLELNKK